MKTKTIDLTITESDIKYIRKHKKLRYSGYEADGVIVILSYYKTIKDFIGRDKQ